MKINSNFLLTSNGHAIKIRPSAAAILLLLQAPAVYAAQETKDDRNAVPAPSLSLSAATANRTSPYDPPSNDVFVSDNGGGLDTGCTFNTDSNHPLVIEIAIDKFVGDVDADGHLLNPAALIAAGIIPATVEVNMPAYDVDVNGGPPPESDDVLLNDEPVGKLTGDNGIWKLNGFNIDIQKVKFPQRPPKDGSVTPATNKIQINVDTLSSGTWCTAIDWVALQIPVRPKLALEMSVGEGGNQIRQNTGEDTIDVIYEQTFDEACVVTNTKEAIDAYPFSGFANGGNPTLKAKIKTCPENSLEPPEVKVDWVVNGGESNSETWTGLEGKFPVTMPDKVGSYTVDFTYTVNDKKNNHEETINASRKLFATKGRPDSTVYPPRRAWYEKATAWGAGESDEAAIHAAVLQGVYGFGGSHWQYTNTACVNNWEGMVNEPITCTQADCYDFSDVFSAMSKTLGVSGMYRHIEEGSQKRGFLTVLGQQSLDPAFKGNAKPFGGGVYDRYRFRDHSLRLSDDGSKYYDASFNKIYATSNQFVAFNQTGEKRTDVNGDFFVTIEDAKIYEVPEPKYAPASPGAEWPNLAYLLPTTAAPALVLAQSANTETSTEALQFPGTANYRLLDADNDGVYEALAVDVDVDVTQSGSYAVSCSLWKNGLIIANGGFRSSSFCEKSLTAEPGRHSVTLDLRGQEIFSSGADGPYELKLYSSGESGVATISLQTPAYDHQIFGELLANITGAHDEGVDEDADGMLEGIRVSMDLNVRASGNYRFAGYLYKDGTRLDSQAYVADVLLTSGQKQYSFMFPGLPLRRSGLDGPYKVVLTLEESSGEGNRYATSFEINTQPYQSSDFASVFELVDGSVIDEGIDSNGNGLFDTLIVNVEASFPHAGTYALESRLKMTHLTGSRSMPSTIQSITVAPGNRQLSLVYDGTNIFNQQIDGPYSIEVTLRDPVTDKVIDRLPLPQQTQSYSYTQFDPNDQPIPAIMLSGTSSNRGVDTDADGLFNQLQVDVGVKLKDSGTYDWSARLVDAAGTEIGFFTRQAALNAGDSQINFVFDGARIGRNGKDGPYLVKGLLMAGPNGSNLVSIDVAKTGDYKASEFEDYAPPKIRGDLNGDGQVDDLDIEVLKQALGSKVGDPKYNPDADLYRDERINGRDLQVLRDLIKS